VAKSKRKTLPKDFAEQLSSKSIDELKAIFATTKLTAYGTWIKDAPREAGIRDPTG